MLRHRKAQDVLYKIRYNYSPEMMMVSIRSLPATLLIVTYHPLWRI